MPLVITILAAGKGTRMKSSLPKVLQPLSGVPLLTHVINTAQKLNSKSILGIVGHGSKLIKQTFDTQNLTWIEQQQQLGTGHAVMQTVDVLEDNDVALILYGDVPLIKTKTLQNLVSLVNDNCPLALLTVLLDDPTGYGRIIRNSKKEVKKIVEEKDASPNEAQQNEVNTGMMAVNAKYLKQWLNKLTPKNMQGEYYLTDIVSLCVADGQQVKTTQPENIMEVLGVNDKEQLQRLERKYQYQLAIDLMRDGVTIIDANRIDIRGKVQAGKDVTIDVNVIFEGKVELEDGVKIGSNCILKSCKIGKNTVIEANSYLDRVNVGINCTIGPFARLRPETFIDEGVKIGNFVEIKKSTLGKGSKVNHLSYIGDTTMGQSCNIGAGTITCNYDGINKHETIIKNRVFVGSNSQIVAPVILNDDSVIGAGSTITKDTPEGKITLSRVKQKSVNKRKNT